MWPRFAALSLGLVLFVACLTPSAVEAQTPADTTRRAELASPVHLWVTQPTRIDLTEPQEKQVRALETKYVEEFEALKALGDDMAIVMGARELQLRYQKLVREVLTPTQQIVFEKNVQAASGGGGQGE